MENGSGCFGRKHTDRYMRHTAFLLIALLVSAQWTTSSARRWSIGTNLLDYADFLTVNAEAGMSVDRHWSVGMKARYHPFHFCRSSGDRIQNKTLTISAGARYWPFFTYSGFFYGAKIQWDRYNTGGILSPSTIEGDAWGAGLHFGYALMLGRHINIEFGLGLWTGWASYREYSSPVCGKRTGCGSGMFIAPDDIAINIIYIF